MRSTFTGAVGERLAIDTPESALNDPTYAPAIHEDLYMTFEAYM